MASSSQALLKIVNPIVLVLFSVQAAGGFLHDQIPYAIFSPAHKSVGLLMTVGITLHIVLNRKWFTTAFKRKK